MKLCHSNLLHHLSNYENVNFYVWQCVIKILKEGPRIMYSDQFNFWYTPYAKGPGCENFSTKWVQKLTGEFNQYGFLNNELVDIGL